MPNWKKVIVSGSDATLKHITAESLTISSGSLPTLTITSGSNTHTVTVASDGALEFRDTLSNETYLKKSKTTGSCSLITIGNNVDTVGGSSIELDSEDQTVKINTTTTVLGANASTIGTNKTYSTIIGGESNSINANCTAVVGGRQNVGDGILGFLGGGVGNCTGASRVASIGGRNNTVAGCDSGVVTGCGNTIENGAQFATIIAGRAHDLLGPGACYSAIIGGCNTSLTGNHNLIATSTLTDITAGTYNTVISTQTTQISGSSNTVLNGQPNSVVTGDQNVLIGSGSISCNYSTSIGTNNVNTHEYTFTQGYNAQATGLHAVSIGKNACATGQHSKVMGLNSTASHAHSYVFGCGITSTAADYFYVNNLCNVGGGTSDKRLKYDINELPYGLTEISKLTPVSYKFKSDESATTRYGFLAQEIQKIIPELITHHPVDTVNNTPVLQFDREAIWSTLVNAVKELSLEVDKLKSCVSSIE